MCGFVGYKVRQGMDDTRIIQSMCNEIVHRGATHDSFVDKNFALGLQRLSIVDPEHGTQPMTDATGNFTIIFNGEIYNYKEIKKILLDKGYKFNNQSDTEVILNAYIEYGQKVASLLRGMFSFVVYDKKNNLLYGARDHFGIKPFYYYHEQGQLMFSSEIKAFLRHPRFTKAFNRDALKPYLIFQANMLEETFFKDVYKLPPAHYFIYKDDEMQITKYFEYSFKRENNSESDALRLLKEAISESISAHTDTEKDLCTFLSSGIDSSLITTLLRPQKAYSAGFDSMFNETLDAKMLCELTDVGFKEVIVTERAVFGEIEKIVFHLDEPHANPSLVPLYFLAKEARKNFDIVLTGEGADELFGGYYLYSLNTKFELYDKTPKILRKILSSLFSRAKFLPKAKFFIDGKLELRERFIGHAKIFNESELGDFVKVNSKFTVASIVDPIYEEVKGEDYITQMQYLDLNLWLPNDILMKADKMTMAHTLEARVPYLDIKLFEIASNLNTKFLAKGHVSKPLLRDVTRDKLPIDWVNRKKLGFPVPIKDWVKGEVGYNYIKELFSEEWVSEFFNVTFINSMLDEHRQGKTEKQRKIWTIMIFLVWYKRFFVESGPA